MRSSVRWSALIVAAALVLVLLTSAPAPLANLLVRPASFLSRHRTAPPPQHRVATSQLARYQHQRTAKPPAAAAAAASDCGDDVCQPPETSASCPADCTVVTTPPSCGEEPHSDPQGNAVVDGRSHHVASPAECCDACAAHARKSPRRPCNSWVFCPLPHCWSADNGNTHLFGECWLKWQSDPSRPLYGQRGRYTDEYRRRNADKHLNGQYPTDANSAKLMAPFGIVPGSRRNLTVPTHVVWIGGVMGAPADTSIRWTTDADGTMRSSAGEVVVDYRPWESREQNLRRGVKKEQMQF
jgi:hypothetical protein